MSSSVTRANEKDLYFWGRTPRYIYEDEQCVVFDEEVKPQAPVHFLVVPRKIIPRICHVTEDEEQMLGHMLLVAKNMAYEKGLEGDGYHVIIDEDPRSVRLKAIHVFGRALHHMLGYGPGAKL